MTTSGCINYTPLAHLTDEEFLLHLANKQNASDEEVEAMLRLEAGADKLLALEEELNALFLSCRKTRADAKAVIARSRELDSMQTGMFP